MKPDASPAGSDDRVRVVLLGTGTDVGKTWFGASLCRALRQRGADCLALKPVESGWTPGSSDAERLAAASGHEAPPSPYRFDEPISPHLAARRSNRLLSVAIVRDQVLAASRDMPCHAMSFTIVETAGGLFSPLAPGVTNWDVARALDPALWVLVAADSLGVLHDVTATLEAARARGRAPDFVVLSAARASDASTGTNAAELARLGIVIPAAALTRGDTDLSRFAAELMEAARSRTASP